MNLSTFTNRVGEFLTTAWTPARTEDQPSIERRAYSRPPVRFSGTLDAGEQRISVRGIDLHRAGARVATHRPLPNGTVVFFLAKSHGLMGWAQVRWGAWKGQTYHLGLEFRNPLMRAEAGTWHFSCVLSPPGTGDSSSRPI